MRSIGLRLSHHDCGVHSASLGHRDRRKNRALPRKTSPRRREYRANDSGARRRPESAPLDELAAHAVPARTFGGVSPIVHLTSGLTSAVTEAAFASHLEWLPTARLVSADWPPVVEIEAARTQAELDGAMVPIGRTDLARRPMTRAFNTRDVGVPVVTVGTIERNWHPSSGWMP